MASRLRGDTPLIYRVTIADAHAHRFRIELRIADPPAETRVSLPVWIPGSYLVREFSRQLQKLEASQRGEACRVEPIDKCTWRILAEPGRPLDLCWEVYAFDPSVRAAWLDAGRAFFNPTSLCLRVHGQEDLAHGLRLPRSAFPAGWSVATGLAAAAVDAQGFGDYRAADYDELADSPFELGRLRIERFEAAGVPHRFVVTGAADSFDAERLIQDTRRICETAIRFWHRRGKPPHADYLFLLHAVDDGYGGLEHRNSTALICGRRDLPRLGASRSSEGYVTLLGLISHEYFHTWNVKRLRPAEFARYDYARENYTELLWFFEGFTSYYDDLLLHRAGLIDRPTYLRLLGKTINQVLQTPGRAVQSVAQASRDAWIRYYRPDEGTPNSTVSYYTKGALVALCLDLTLRGEGRGNLDDVMRGLWRHCAGGPMTEDDLLSELQRVAGRSMAPELAEWVHGTGELPLRERLRAHGVQVSEEPDAWAQRLGLRVSEDTSGIRIKNVLRGGAAEKAGLAAGDEWLGIETRGAGPRRGWRLQRLDDLALYAGTTQSVQALVSRDRQLLRLPLRLTAGGQTWRLAPGEQPGPTRWPLP